MALPGYPAPALSYAESLQNSKRLRLGQTTIRFDVTIRVISTQPGGNLMLKQMKTTGVHLAAALVVALGLAGCGGGGGGDSPAPATAGGTSGTGSTGGTAGTGGTVAGGGGGTVTPPTVLLGTTWTARATAQPWHYVTTSSDGQVIVAGEGVQAAGSTANLFTSSDGGATFTTLLSPGNFTWIAADASATGDVILAAEYGGGLYRSTNKGVTYTRVTSSALVNAAAGQPFESVTVSGNGQQMAVVIQGGNLVYSNDGGATWFAVAIPGGARAWRSVDTTSDGAVTVAAAHDALFICSNSGANTAAAYACTDTPVRDGTTVVNEGWYRTKISGDGSTIALAANTFATGSPGTGVYVTRDRGVTWTKPVTLVANYTGLSMSDNAQVIGVTLSTTGAVAGRALISSDSGVTFRDVTPAADPNWRSIAISGDGQKAVAAAGLFAPSTNGLLYTSP
jgi:hypothetical protein